MKVLAAFLLLAAVTVPLGYPDVWPRSPETPRHLVEQECCCADGGDCWCVNCPCVDHGVLLQEPQVDQ
jgi:hypothetical protein